MATLKPKFKIPSMKIKMPKLPKIKPLPKIKSTYVGTLKPPKVKKLKIF
jgi:hypothetical protein